MKRIGIEISEQHVTIREDFVTIFSISLRFVTISVSSDQISPFYFLLCYILRAKLGRMKRIGIEISAVCYDSLLYRADKIDHAGF